MFGSTLIRVEGWFGCCTVSSKDLEQKTRKVVYSVTLLVVCVTDLFIFYYSQIEGTKWAVFVNTRRALRYVILMYTYYKAIYNYRTKISAIMDLDEIRKILEERNIEIPAKWMQKVTLWVAVLFFILDQIMILNIFLDYFIDDNEIDWVDLYNLYYFGVQFCLYYGTVGSVVVTYNIQRAINIKLEVIKTAYTREDRNLRSTLDDRISKKKLTKDLMFLKKIQGSLFNCERDLNSCYWMYVPLFVLLVSAWTPYLLIMGYFEFPGVETYLVMCAISTSVVYVCALVVLRCCLRAEKTSSLQKLSDLLVLSRSEERRRPIKHLLLAAHHRSPPLFNCIFFDLDWGLLAVVLDTTLLIVCTIDMSHFSSQD